MQSQMDALSLRSSTCSLRQRSSGQSSLVTTRVRRLVVCTRLSPGRTASFYTVHLLPSCLPFPLHPDQLSGLPGGSGSPTPRSESVSLLTDIHLFHVPTLSWLPALTPSTPPDLSPTPRLACLSSISSSHLIIAGGQTLDGKTILETNVFDLRRRIWVAKQESGDGISGAFGWSSTLLKAKNWVVKRDEDMERVTFSATEEFGGESFCYTTSGVSLTSKSSFS